VTKKGEISVQMHAVLNIYLSLRLEPTKRRGFYT
jgi:hypothetical protein